MLLLSRMQVLFTLLLSLLFSLSSQALPVAAALEDPPPFAVLSAGRSFEWKAPAGVAITVSDGSVVRVSDFGSRVKITGKKQGSSVVRAGAQAITVHVLPPPIHRLFDSLTASLKVRRGLFLTIENKQVAVRGRLLRFEDWMALSEVADREGAAFTFEADLTPELRSRAQARFKTLLRDAHLPELAVDLDRQATVTVPTDPADLRDRVSRVLNRFGFRVDASSSALSLEPLVRVKLVVAEVRKNRARTLGVEWPDRYTAQLIPSDFPVNAGLAVDLRALESNGTGKILASPTLLCRSGKSAEFLAGGEFPIKNSGFKTQDVTWKKYGVLLKISPKADFAGRMSIAIETEVSMIDGSTTIDGIPGLLTNRIESHFDLASSRTIVLSGLIKKEWSESTRGLPGLSRLPILGPLFSSEDFRDERTELVVFVTPELARPGEENL